MSGLYSRRQGDVHIVKGVPLAGTPGTDQKPVAQQSGIAAVKARTCSAGSVSLRQGCWKDRTGSPSWLAPGPVPASA